MNSKTYARLATPSCPDSDLPLIQELLSYHMLCDTCCTFARDEHQKLHLALQPSPLHWSRQVEWPWAVREADLRPFHECLDVGAGWSVMKYAVAKRCRFLECVDNDPPSVEKAWATTKKMGVRNVVHAQADAARLPNPDALFDRVFCVSVLEHVRIDHAACVRELVRVLKPGGVLVMTLDVADSPGETDFFIDGVGFAGILEVLGIAEVEVPRGPRCRAAMPDGTEVTCALVRYVKPAETPPK